jgi:hypothetical protein
MPPGRRRERPEPERPTFFIDRSVGRRDVPNTLLPAAKLTGPQMAERISLHLNRVLQRARKPGPYLYLIHAHSIELRWRGDET